MDVGRGWSLAVGLALLVSSACRGHPSSDTPRRLDSVVPKLGIRPPLVLIPDDAPEVPLAPQLPPPTDPDGRSGNTEPDPTLPKELRRKSFESLPLPLYLRSHRSGNCGGTLAVDGAFRIWTESGCEHTSTGVVSSERLTAKQRRRFAAALAKLPRLRDIPKYPSCQHTSTVRLFERNGRQHTWRVCPPNDIPPEIAAVDAAVSSEP